ncbi:MULTISPECIES: hypothetical protein [Paenibacillus]|uniref:Sporulation membrane protein YtrI C-terminal domain-containing protein n=1 Tax=Paenibacillus naphthalenovorans TaxID=162209 RepID=A0A0U2U3F2_9BACL|nr:MULTISPECIES: hypothetical protein [Paenibacillus]ALS20856.1 hypothetical protein IJ22_04680 [Paenibacillus naphthalenovorans]NTZ18938.1 hypothetical protein [Paenibacillus sp. JMULE4]GCL70887.1 hypothetical protein PN4B1_07900 [Paenibacillus naphthalenovorans]SDI19818.1 hypothetical protein SAMN05421868_10440 [Paenibacillus naphthalenovorans]
MKIPPHESAGNVLRAVGLLIAGMIIGAALFLSIYNQRLNMMIVQNRELVSENVRLEGEVEDLKKNKNQQNTINLLNIYVESADDSPLDKITESELKRRIHGELKKIIVGRKISDFAAMPDVYEQILKEKPYTGVLDKDYIVQSVRWIVLTQTELKVWVTVKEWKRIPMA